MKRIVYYQKQTRVHTKKNSILSYIENKNMKKNSTLSKIDKKHEEKNSIIKNRQET